MIIDELKQRNVLSDVTNESDINQLLDNSIVTVYCGFDPTADSLHVGSLLPLINMKRFSEQGHNVIALVGGATGFIGDPSFKTNERQLNDAETINHYKESIKQQITTILGNNVTIVDNLDWTENITIIDFLRDIGKHFSVNAMINKESVKQRINRDGEGISFTEFSYQLLQGMDFLKLKEKYDCSLQIGGSDQMGNITSGISLIHKKLGNNVPAYGLTTKLLTKSDGEKFGKSESGTVWLDPNKTSPFDFYQFWLRTDDKDVYDFLKYLTFLSVETIDQIEFEDKNRKPIAQELLAKELTLLVHGKDGYDEAINVTNALVNDSYVHLSINEVAIVNNGITNIKYTNSISLVDAIIDTDLATSRKMAREFINNNSIKVNGNKCSDINMVIGKNDSIHSTVFLKRGKRNLASITFNE